MLDGLADYGAMPLTYGANWTLHGHWQVFLARFKKQNFKNLCATQVET